jgi:hypothetical protein
VPTPQRPRHAQRGIDQDATGGLGGLVRLELENGVHQRIDVPDIVEKVGDTLLREIGHDPLVTTHRGQEHVAVEPVVEVVDPLVHA